MNLGHLLWTVFGGAAITLALSYLLRRVLPRLTQKTNSDFDDFVLSALADAVIPIGLVTVLVLTEIDLNLPANVKTAYDIALRGLTTIVLVRFANRVGSRFLTSAARAPVEKTFNNCSKPAAPAESRGVGCGHLVLLQAWA